MVTPNSILKYIGSFLGYGNLKSPFWFIGMEEGGGKEIDRRFESWEARGCRSAEDLVEFHQAMGNAKWFLPPVPLQTTWRHLIRVYQNAYGLESNIEAIRDFQMTRLGRAGISAVSSPCIFELMPLPSPRLGAWPYERFAKQHQELAFLENRQKYEDAVLFDRIQFLRQQIEIHKPRVVCFFGLKYVDHWNQITGIELSAQRVNGQGEEKSGIFRSGFNNSTLFIVTAHPSAPGVSNLYFNGVGRTIRCSL